MEIQDRIDDARMVAQTDFWAENYYKDITALRTCLAEVEKDNEHLTKEWFEARTEVSGLYKQCDEALAKLAATEKAISTLGEMCLECKRIFNYARAGVLRKKFVEAEKERDEARQELAKVREELGKAVFHSNSNLWEKEKAEKALEEERKTNSNLSQSLKDAEIRAANWQFNRDKERTAKEEALAWGEKMREDRGHILLMLDAVCSCGKDSCSVCAIARSLRKDTYLTPPQAYKDWASRMGRLSREISHALKYLDSLGEIEPSDPEAQMRDSFRKALSDQEGKQAT